MCAPSPPPPPDYTGAAVAQGAANTDASRATAKLSNPNVNNPYGSQTVAYGVNGDQDQAQVNQTFSPSQQALFEKSNQTKGLLGDLGIQGATALSGVVGTNLDISGAPAAPSGATATRDKVINAMMSRVDTDIGRSRDQSNSDMIAAGIRPGTEAYSRAMEGFDRQRTDALQQAQLASGQEAQRDFGIDTDARRSAIAEILAKRQTPLNEVTALTSGSQVQNPFAGGLGYQAGAQQQPAPIFAGAQAQGQAGLDAYGQEVGGYNNMMSGLFGLGSAGVAKYSDRRLKTNISRIGTHKLGIGLYEWDYLWGEHAVGVMADEVEAVMPLAVGSIGGYKTVNYSMIGG